jgi:AcrR family transcriptional regulator
MNCPATFRKRSERTRRQIMSAFTGLVFAEGFENVSVLEVVASANVARSTFYEHFSGKEDVLRACMSRLFAVIADCVPSDTEPGELNRVLDHLWENRRLTDAFFSGAPRVILARALGETIEAHLRDMNQGEPLALPYRLSAIHLAEAQLALVENWLRGRAYCETADLAQALHKSSRASALALLAPADCAKAAG